MSYLDLVEALREEVGAEIARIQADAREGERRILAEAQDEIAATRERTLCEVHRDTDARLARARAEAKASDLRAELLARERLLDQLRGRIAESLGTLRVAPQMLAEIVPELPAGPVEIRVAPAEVGLLTPDGATVVADESIVAGVVAVAGPVVLDNSLPARLDRLWPQAAPEIARVLFGGPDGAL